MNVASSLGVSHRGLPERRALAAGEWLARARIAGSP